MCLRPFSRFTPRTWTSSSWLTVTYWRPTWTVWSGRRSRSWKRRLNSVLQSKPPTRRSASWPPFSLGNVPKRRLMAISSLFSICLGKFANYSNFQLGRRPYFFLLREFFCPCSIAVSFPLLPRRHHRQFGHEHCVCSGELLLSASSPLYKGTPRTFAYMLLHHHNFRWYYII